MDADSDTELPGKQCEVPKSPATGKADAGQGGMTSFLRVACWLALLGGVAALASPWLAGYWIGFDLFTQLLPHMVAFALAAAICLLRSRWTGVVAGVMIVGSTVAGLAFLGLSHTSPGFDKRTSGEVMRIMSFNLWRGNNRVDSVEREIRRNLPDIVALPEFEHDAMLNLPDRLKDILPYHADCLHKPFCYLGLLSRWPIVRVKSASLWEGPPYLHAWVKTPDGVAHVYVTHTLRMPWIRSHYKQVNALARIVRLRRGEPVIVLGDFNAAPFSYILNTFQRRTDFTRHTWLPTWPVHPLRLPQIAIDHVFTSSHFLPHAGPWVGRYAGSDHLPVIMELGWQGVKDQ